jgi:hypothetical protein
VLGAIAGAFYAGRQYRGNLPFISATGSIAPLPSPEAVTEDPILRFERARREVDHDPSGWLSKEQTQLAGLGLQTPLDSADPEFLYLHGRASLLTGNNDEAARAFESAIARTAQSSTGESSTVRKEATLGLAAISLRSEKERPRALTRYDEMLQKPATSSSP